MTHADMKGKIDHSTAGAQIAWRNLYSGQDDMRDLLAEIISLSIASHHSGLIDCIAPDGTDVLTRRMCKSDNQTHLSEIESKIPPVISNKISEIFANPKITAQIKQIAESLKARENRVAEKSVASRLRFKMGILLRLLYSCLVDADRTDTINFQKAYLADSRLYGRYMPWSVLAGRLEEYISAFKSDTIINKYRSIISDNCRQAAERDKGIFTLTVPTGGGKTLASLRFALHHARHYAESNCPIEHIFYIVPYTSIIDQNARIAREVLECQGDGAPVVLECHSNLAVENETWRGRLLSENWDAPVVFTTSVQFLEAIFGGGTKSVRKMHQLVNSIIIFDEIQTLPLRVVHMFCNAVNFLVEACGSTVVLCTATQPLLNEVNPQYGALSYSGSNEITNDTGRLFEVFRRVDVINMYKHEGYTYDEVADMAISEQNNRGSCLVVLNTTKTAKEVYIAVKKKFSGTVLHLSANMCPAHRALVFERIKASLSPDLRQPLICISTQVIEAGVDVDFDSVIRSIAGLDSIAQAAGRCNRHGLRGKGRVLLINIKPELENIDMLEDIRIGKDVTLRLLNEEHIEAGTVCVDLFTPDMITRYFGYYFYNRKNDMVYKINKWRNDTLLEILSNNTKAVWDYKKYNNIKPNYPLRQSFASASKIFNAIDSLTQGVIVPYKEGKDIISELCGEYNIVKFSTLLRKAQKYSVNIYNNKFKQLCDVNAVYAIKDKTDKDKPIVWVLRQEFYSSEFGFCTEVVNKIKSEVK